MIAWRAALAGTLALLSVGLRAEQPKNIVDEIRALPSPSARIEQANAAARAQFDVALAEYDARIAQYPYDVLERVQQCRFIDEFVAGYEYAAFVDELSERADECREKLAEAYASHPEVVLLKLEQTYGEARLTSGAELLRKLLPGTWTAGQLARLYTVLAQTAEVSGNRALALDYALKALELDEASDVRLSAATHLIARGEKKRAYEILTARPGDGAPEDGFALARKMDLLSQLGAHQEVIALYSQLRTLQGYNHTQVARLLGAAGDTDLARLELKRAGEGGQFTSDDERERFRLELQWGSAEQALAAYQAWRDVGWTEDILGINRFAVFVRDPLLPWRARDLLGPLGFIAALGAIALVCALPIAGVHYRGLAVRARSGEAYPTQGPRLLNAWLALFCFAAASVLALYSAGSVDLASQQAQGWGIDATPLQLATIALVETLFALALLLPVAAGVNSRQARWWGTQWSIAKSCAVGAALALAFRIPFLLLQAAQPESVRALGPEDALLQVIGAVRDHYGIAAALWILVVAAPVIEELVFRGVLYRAFAVHLRPGWANVLQAALFSAMHLNLSAAVLLFAVGWVLGTLTRRSGGLLAPMVMHAVFNLVVGLMFFG